MSMAWRVAWPARSRRCWPELAAPSGSRPAVVLTGRLLYHFAAFLKRTRHAYPAACRQLEDERLGRPGRGVRSRLCRGEAAGGTRGGDLSALSLPGGGAAGLRRYAAAPRCPDPQPAPLRCPYRRGERADAPRVRGALRPGGALRASPALPRGGRAGLRPAAGRPRRSEEHTSELQSRPHLVCRLLLEKKNKRNNTQK